MDTHRSGAEPKYGVPMMPIVEKNVLDTEHNNGHVAEDIPKSPMSGTSSKRRPTMELPRETEHRIHVLARQFSNMSTTTNTTVNVNPFHECHDPFLDPSSPRFSAEHWAKTYLNAVAREAERFPQRTAGISYRELDVFGFGSRTDYQKDILNVWFHAIDVVKSSFRQKERIPILTDFDGLVKSGEMCLVLGRPGSGVSTLLKTISAKTDGLWVSEQAQFNYQGISREHMASQFRGEIIYQAETDVHFPHLTVGQTLMFAALARTPKNRLEGVTRNVFAEHMRDVAMAVLGLSHTVDTKIGNDYIRGVSGGERKRVSIAEVLLSQSQIQCWDNSTRGLDSATALQFVKTLGIAGSLTGSTALVAAYQASQDMYDIFDKVALLYEGRQIYFGPQEFAKKYFIDMGYICHPRQTTADFLTSLTNPSERIIAPGFENKVPRTADEFAQRWAMSENRRFLLQDIDDFEQQFALSNIHLEKFKASRRAQQASSTRAQSPYTISVPMQVKICIVRGFQRLRGDKTFTTITVLGNLLISLVLGSIFLNLPDSTASFYGRGALLFVVVLFNALTSALEILPMYATRPVVQKHSSFALVHPLSEAIASMICEFPSKVICAIAFNIPLYFMADLRREAGPIFVYLLFAFTCTLSMSMIFRTIAQVSRTLSQAMAPIALFIIALIVYTGFVLPIRSMQGLLRWLNYLNPVAYAFEALMANEFHNRNFPCAQFIPAGLDYLNATGTERSCLVAGGAPGSNFVNGDTYISSVYKYENFGILITFILFFSFVYLLVAENLLFEISKGEVLIFHRGHKYVAKTKSPRDEESQTKRTSDSLPARASSEAPSSGEILGIQRQISVFHWKDLCYQVPIKGKPRVILDHVNGWVKPGTLTALMGATGAGKTSLLNVLADRADVGIVSGDVLINGHRRSNSFQRDTGYVQQQDVHLPTSTVREALIFSAFLRQPASVRKEEKVAYVEEVIRLLEMKAYEDAVVGVPGEGLNVEQRKRLTIGVELAAKPGLLFFLDEPTSGLDSQTAWSITMLIRKLANNGQAILCTIHQPSGILFEQFDRLLLLANGGRTVYFGDIGSNAKQMISYFERHGAKHCEPQQNPAEWMLEVIGAAPGVTADRDWVQTWRESTEFTSVIQDLDDMQKKLPKTTQQEENSSSSRSFASSFHFQLYMCLKRAFEQYWRDPSYIYAKLGQGLFLGLSFFKEALSLQGLQNQMFSFFMLLMIQVFMAYQAMPNFVTQRLLYEARERPSKTYSWGAFMLANILVEIPWSSLAAVIIFLCMYYPIGMYHNAELTDALVSRGGLMFLLIWVFMMFGSTLTNMVVAGVETAEVGAIIAVILFAFSLIFCGVLVTKDDLPRFWIFMYRVSPFTYLLSAFLSTSLANAPVTCGAAELVSISPFANQTCAQYMAPYIQLVGGTVINPDAVADCLYCSIAETNVFLESIGSEFSERWRNFGIMWAYVIFNATAAVGLYWLARVPKGLSFGSLLRKLKPKVIEEVH
ncbi:hypothetical protein G7Y89_g6633 [Cudoniella acicularis]|uniref:ABC transporter domain-containing protein n=1 Tax=Cudoniella acicularis TaxID=354080 RepID=A0A8H4RLK6_9HELO|nr:hypothetical protein G7Y89_g6633 [Cudoniella acicularis]